MSVIVLVVGAVVAGVFVLAAVASAVAVRPRLDAREAERVAREASRPLSYGVEVLPVDPDAW